MSEIPPVRLEPPPRRRDRKASKQGTGDETVEWSQESAGYKVSEGIDFLMFPRQLAYPILLKKRDHYIIT